MDYDEKRLVEEMISHLSNLAHHVERIANHIAPYRGGGSFVGCVVAGQLVATPDGGVPVERVCTGANILSYDVSVGTTETTLVQSHREVLADEYLLINGELAVTGVHRIFSEERGWIHADTAQLGEQLRTVNGPRKILSAELMTKPTSVYALEVAQYSCFYASGYLVHNKP